ncbi:hypothetical protein ACFL1S_08690, partial [Pseudomonadota bacterium]
FENKVAPFVSLLSERTNSGGPASGMAWKFKRTDVKFHCWPTCSVGVARGRRSRSSGDSASAIVEDHLMLGRLY